MLRAARAERRAHGGVRDDLLRLASEVGARGIVERAVRLANVVAEDRALRDAQHVRYTREPARAGEGYEDEASLLLRPAVEERLLASPDSRALGALSGEDGRRARDEEWVRPFRIVLAEEPFRRDVWRRAAVAAARWSATGRQRQGRERVPRSGERESGEERRFSGAVASEEPRHRMRGRRRIDRRFLLVALLRGGGDVLRGLGRVESKLDVIERADVVERYAQEPHSIEQPTAARRDSGQDLERWAAGSPWRMDRPSSCGPSPVLLSEPPLPIARTEPPAFRSAPAQGPVTGGSTRAGHGPAQCALRWEAVWSCRLQRGREQLEAAHERPARRVV